MPPPGPKELANRANADAKRERKLIPYAGKEPHQGGVPFTKTPRPPNDKPQRQRRKYKRKIT